MLFRTRSTTTQTLIFIYTQALNEHFKYTL